MFEDINSWLNKWILAIIYLFSPFTKLKNNFILYFYESNIERENDLTLKLFKRIKAINFK